MQQKTIHLSDDYCLRDGDVYEIDVHEADDYKFTQHEYLDPNYRVGKLCVLFSQQLVGSEHEQWGLAFDEATVERGLTGNANPEIRQFSGWRGTTNNVMIHAYGRRRITAIRELKNGCVAVTVGPDVEERDALNAEWSELSRDIEPNSDEYHASAKRFSDEVASR